MKEVRNTQINVSLIVNKYFNVVESYSDKDYLEYVVLSAIGNVNDAFEKLYVELVGSGAYPILQEINGIKVLRIYISDKKRRTTTVPIALFVITLASIFLTGYLIALDYFNSLRIILGIHIHFYDVILQTLLFTVCIIAPLIAHEVGHWYTAKKYFVPTSYPLFIPAPLISPLGTFGAVVKMEFFPKSLVDLLKLGITGPMLGFIVSFFLFIINYMISPRIPVSLVNVALKEGVVRPLSIAPLLIMLVLLVDVNRTGIVVLLSPATYASLLIVLIHFLNLLPIGQLDGGHVIRGLTSIRTHTIISYLTAIIIFFISITILLTLKVNIMWIPLFALVALIISGLRPHIGSANMLSNYVSKGVKLKTVILYIFLLVMTAPIPLSTLR